MRQVERGERWVNNASAKTDAKTSGTAEPAILLITDECSAFNVAASAVHDVTRAHEVAIETPSIGF